MVNVSKDTYLALQEVIVMGGLSRMSLYRRMARSDFPKGIKQSPR